jgi:hypothetical protein
MLAHTRTVEIACQHEHLVALTQALDDTRALNLIAAHGDRWVKRGENEDAHPPRR